jgi:hypothetical protein
MKPGNEADGFNVETEMLSEYCNIVGDGVSECSGTGDAGILQSAQLAKPVWNGESGYAGVGWAGANGALDLSGNPDMQASFIARYALFQWSLGIQNFDWYAYDLDNNLNGSSVNGTGTQVGDPALAFSSMNTWMVGQTMSTSCSNVSGTKWECDFTGPNGFEAMAVWDTSTTYDCNADSVKGNDCSYYWGSLSDTWTYYRDVWGHETAIPTTGMHAHQVQLGNLPVLLENQQL